jgi:hypothetical protein
MRMIDPEPTPALGLGRAQTAGPLYRIRSGVEKVKRANTLILVAPEDGRAMRMSVVGEELLPLLACGASLDELAQRLRERHPEARDIQSKLTAFLDQLARGGLIEADARQRAPRHPNTRFRLFRPDPAAAWVATRIHALPPIAVKAALALASLASLAGVVMLIASGHLPHPGALWTAFSPWGLALFALVVVPSHEAAHALACRLAGQPVNEGGVILHAWLIPGPYVDTSQMYRISSRWKRFWVPAAGPLVNLLALGAAAWWLTLAGSLAIEEQRAASTLFVLCAVFVYLDTNPLAPSDGSRMLEAILGDELARRAALSRTSARLSGAKTVAWYRIACSAHLQLSALLGYAWWRWAA